MEHAHEQVVGQRARGHHLLQVHGDGLGLGGTDDDGDATGLVGGAVSILEQQGVGTGLHLATGDAQHFQRYQILVFHFQILLTACKNSENSRLYQAL